MEWLNTTQVLAIVCAQFGDSGKGKLVDHFAASWADIIIRGTGGANAGHTICIGSKQFIFHLIPCGILNPDKINIIGSGVAFDPKIFCEELNILASENIAHNNLYISSNAKVVLLSHIVLDVVRERFKGRIGSTGRGMSPVYEAYVGRKGFIVNDLLNPKTFENKLERNLTETIMLLKAYQHELLDKHDTTIRTIMEELGYVDFYNKTNIFDLQKMLQYYLDLGAKIDSMIVDTSLMAQEALKNGKKILLEGSQGTLLSILHGTYPYVTSSDSTIRGLAEGSDLSVTDVDHTILVVKAPYMTRVGGGPFPTEMGGTQSASWCRKESKIDELKEFGHLDFTTVSNEFELGICIRITGQESGATTGRLRRVGWLDLVALRYAMRVNNTQHVALMKLDVLSNCSQIKVCTTYRYTGPDFRYGEKTLRNNDLITDFIPTAEVLEYCVPIYKEFNGYGDIRQYTSREQMDMDAPLSDFLQFIEQQGIIIDLISNGPDRDQTILC